MPTVNKGYKGTPVNQTITLKKAIPWSLRLGNY